jgi:hypothetical protein
MAQDTVQAQTTLQALNFDAEPDTGIATKDLGVP